MTATASFWAIDPSSGALKDLGGFGTDPDESGSTLGLSGDVVFYMDSTGAPKGLATIRPCTTSKGSTSCGGSSDYLAGIDMTALAAAYASGTPASTLNAGIYGSPSPSETGPGTGQADVFGLGVWGGERLRLHPRHERELGIARVAHLDRDEWVGRGTVDGRPHERHPEQRLGRGGGDYHGDCYGRRAPRSAEVARVTASAASCSGARPGA